jgi:Fibronectin type III domain
MRFQARPLPRSRRRSAAIVFATLVALAAMAASAQAATYTVGTLSDLAGTCESPASGGCSLRQLVTYENQLAATPNPPDVIVVPAGKYDLTHGELVITQSLVIAGAGARTTNVDVAAGVPAERVFYIQVAKEVAPTVAISGLEISGGTADESNGFFGGDILSAGSLVLDEDWITGGTASSGGGISNDGGTLLVERSLVSGNHASTGGGDSGGIQNHGTAVCGTACSPGKKAVLTVEDSTVAYNDARLGAGIFSWSDAADGNEVTIVRSTIADNTTKEEIGGPARGPGAGLLVGDGTANVAGSILVFNDEINEIGNFTATNCATSVSATIASLGYNLEGGTDCGFKSTGDLQETFPEFSSSELQNNGGNTDTLGLEPTSSAVDAVPAGYPRCNGVDQRGTIRPQGAGCDIGAFELVPLTIRAGEGARFSAQVVTSPPCGVETQVPPTIEWGDGQTSAGTVTETGVSGSHIYTEEGTFNGSVTYVNDCGSHKVAFQAKVADAALKGAGVAVSGTAGIKLTAKVATFTDADPGGAASDYTATIEWGDGAKSAGTVSAAAGGGFEVKGSHTYAAAGQYTTGVTISDVGGAKTTATGSADVVGSPVVSNVSVLSVTETTAKLGFKIDPDGADTTYVIEYGPDTNYGQKTAAVDIGAVPGAQSLTQTLTGLAPNHTYHFNVVATNSAAPGGVGGGDRSFTTVPDAPLNATAEPVSGTAGTKLTAKVASFTDADPTGEVSDYTASIEWGDGTTTAGTVGTAASGGFKVTGTHTYAAAGQYTTGVTITDVGGAKAAVGGKASVVGPPVVSNVKVLAVTETTGKIGFSIDPDGADTTYVIEYGPNASYGQQTATVDIGATPGPQSLTQTLTGLNLNSTYHFDVVATNSAAPGGVGSGDRMFTTEPDAPLSATGESLGGTAGVQMKAKVATFTDADPTGKASDYTASIEWGDGAKSAGTVGAAAGGGFEVTGTHTYTAAGQYKTSVTVTDVGGAKTTAAGKASVVGPPIVSNVKVLAVTETTAKVGFSIDPNGADTTYVVEYGPDTNYGQKTAPVDIGAAPGAQSLTQTLTGLNPNNTYHFNVLATNSVAPVGVAAGDQPFVTALSLISPPLGPQPGPPGGNPPPGPEPKSGVLGFKATLATLPPPVLGKTANVEPVSGVVLIALPPGAKLSSLSPRAPLARASAAVKKGLTFVPLTEARQIPFGSILDTRAGVVRITTATTAAVKGKLQSGDFGAGLFKLLQRRRQRGLTELNIIDSHSAAQVCATLGKARKARIAAAHLNSKVLGRLNASGHGHFTAHGQYSAATVRGTVWSVTNRCDGTLTHVKRGIIAVRDFRRRRTFVLYTGQSYLARAPAK